MACSHDAMHMDEMKHGEDLAFDRCSPGAFAFAKKEDAEAFVAQNGGQIAEHGATARRGEDPMINKIIEFSAKRNFLVFLLVGAAVLFGWQAMKNTKLDAIPDLSDTQVIVYSKWDRSPDIMEDQVTYPDRLGVARRAPKAEGRPAASAKADSGLSPTSTSSSTMGRDIYWARSTHVGVLSTQLLPRLPQGVNVELARGRHGGGVGLTNTRWWIRPCTVQPGPDCALSRTWYLRYALQAVPGVAEVAALGGFVREYQVNVDPNALLGLRQSPSTMVVERRSSRGNNDVGGLRVEFTGRE